MTENWPPSTHTATRGSVARRAQFARSILRRVCDDTCVIDRRWASVGSDNLNRSSWTSDSEFARTVIDERGDLDEPAPEVAFQRVLLRTLVAEHLEWEADDVPEDPHEFVRSDGGVRGRALDQWHAGGARHEVPHPGALTGRLPHRIAPVPRSVAPHIPGHLRRRERVATLAEAISKRGSEHADRPPGQLRRLAPPGLTETPLRWAPRLYDSLFVTPGHTPGPESET